jgi:peptidyl-prolyl cis-trans isomerase C
MSRQENTTTIDQTTTPQTDDEQSRQTGEDLTRPRLFGRLRAHPVIAGLVAAAAAAAIAVPLVVHAQGLPDNAAFDYRGRVVTKTQLDAHVDLLTSLYGITPPKPGSAKVSTFRRDAAKSYAVSLIVDRAAAKLKITVADATVADALDRFIQAEYPKGRDSFISALGQEGLTQKQVSAEIRRQLVVKRLYDAVTASAQVDAADVSTAYATNKASYVRPALRDIRELVVATRPQAADLLARLRKGANFASLVRDNSLDGSTKSQGGRLGKVAKGQLDTAFGPAAFQAPVGSYFGPVRTSTGYFYIGQVLSQDPPRQQTLAQSSDDVRDQLLAVRGLGLWQKYLGKQIKIAHVKYAAAYRPANPDAAPKDVPDSSSSTQPDGAGGTTPGTTP